MESVTGQNEEVDYNSQENQEKRRVKRANKIDELISSEEFYLRDLRLCLQAFSSPSGLKTPEGVDKDTLFYNLPDIIQLSERLLSNLKSAVKCPTFDSQLIGRPFIELKEEMMEPYALYCTHYSEVIKLLEQYKEVRQIRAYFNQGLDLIAKGRPEKPFTVEAFLITPVQRIPRYIMLLMELYEVTEGSHPDKTGLLEARAAQEEVAEYINEFKRRTDIVNKYIRTEKEEEGVFCKANMHSIRKYKNRVSQKIGGSLGLSSRHVDKQFNKHAECIKGLESSIRDFIQNLEDLLSRLKSVHGVREAVATGISEYLSTTQREEVEKYLGAQQNMSALAFKSFKKELEASVQSRLLKLLGLFQGPNKLIVKRNDKRLDYESAQSRFEKDGRETKEDLERARKDFEALNTQLKEELPKFNSLVYDIFRDGITQFTSLYQAYYGESYGFILPILKVSSMSCQTSPVKVVEQFQKRYIGASSQLDRIADPKLIDLSDTPIACKTLVTPLAQTTEVSSRLTDDYHSTKLYQAACRQTASEPMELGLSPGDLAGAAQPKDTKSREMEWPGHHRAGSVIAKRTVIQPHSGEIDSMLAKPSTALSSGTSESIQVPRSDHQSHAGSLPLTVDIRSSLGKVPLANEKFDSTLPHQEHQHKVFKALYNFARRNDNELSLKAGQFVHVYRKHDVHGNPDWWYAETNAGVGYAPANYLAPHNKT